MSRYLARRHRRLMDESEQALLAASESPAGQRSRISRHILDDRKTRCLWESRHARMLVPVAEHRRTGNQIVQLRLMATTLVHGRALIDYIRENGIRGPEREKYFSYYFGTLDYQNAILSAHRQYMLSVSSLVSAEHLIDLMYDPVSRQLLRQYGDVYRQYFDLSSYAATADDDFCTRALTPLIDSARTQLRAIRQRLRTERPDARCAEFEKQAMLARSGRYPVLNYLNA